MCLKVGDMYYGLLLSNLVVYGASPAILEKGIERNIYEVSTNKGDYILYTKYRTHNKEKFHQSTWTFQFTPKEISEIKGIRDTGRDVRVSLVCVNDQKANFKGEVAILTIDEFNLCVGSRQQYRGQPKVCVRYKKNTQGLKVYGSGLADKVGNNETAIRIPKNRMEGL
ncbi:TPA: hypothetical protein SAQ65_002563 [Bacillus cereus]|nr:hypothetical protein [Bacillus cereus]